MASNKIHSTNYTIDDIYRYVNGRMSSEESDAIQQAMTSDPFLRDAVAGIAGHSHIHIDDHLSQLHQRFQQPTAKTRRLVPAWAMAAAAGLALLAIGYGVIRTVDFTALRQLASTDKQEEATESIQAKQRAPQSSQQALTFEAAQEDVNQFDVITADSSEEALVAVETPQTIQRPRKRRPKKKTRRPGIVAGTVTDAEGNPLTGANIFFPNNQATITTDFNGKFAVELRSVDSTAVVNYSGYDSGTFTLSLDGQEQFILNESAIAINDIEDDVDEAREALAEEAVTNQAFAARSVPEPAVAPTVSAEPARGFKKYSRYIKRNRVYPSAAKRAKIKGVVVVKFKVLPNGELFDFRIVQGLGYGCDEEAIRLIKEGPKWELSKPDGIGDVTYEIEFD